jgi:dihydroorotate dehydrogenase electron transfer subunit
LKTSPKNFEAEILVNEPVGNYYRLIFEDNGTLKKALPGQFVNLRLSKSLNPLLRRPFSIARIMPGPRGKVWVEVLYARMREGTRLLSQKKPGETIDVLGPLGRPFPYLDKKHPVLIVSGGIGVAPLVFLAEYLSKKKVPTRVFLGARTADDMIDWEVFKKLKVPLYISTDDGSKGEKGFVTASLEGYLAEGKTPPGTVIYACGPRPMFRAVSKVGEKFKVPTYLSWEEHMGCGLGICLTCVCPVRQEDGEVKMLRTCLEGPVFDAAKVDWEKLG